MLHKSIHIVATIFLAVTLISSSLTVHHAQARSAPDSFADIVESLTPAVVNISTTQRMRQRMGLPDALFPQLPPGSPLEEFREFFEKFRPYDDEMQVERKAYSLGSGFVINPEGYIVTNNHVIAEAEEITVTFNDETELPATIIGRDPKTDLALLKVESDKALPHVRFGDSDDVRVGDWIIAIGNPFGLGGSVTAGIISARARDINAGPFDDFLQTDAAINTGNSGGPMFNLKGEVIGVNTAIFSPSGGNIGIGFATPSAIAEPVIQQIREYGRARRAWLGVKIQTVTDDIAESVGLDSPRGALVVDVTPGSPAEQGGLQPGDVILEFDGKDVTEMRKFPRMVAESDIGTTASLRIWRSNQMERLRVTLEEAEDTELAAMTPEDVETYQEAPAPRRREVAGMQLTPLSAEWRDELGMPGDQPGLVVEEVARSGKAAERGIRPGDVILRVNEQAINSADDLENLLADARRAGRNFALLRIWREGDTHFVTLPTNGAD